MEEIVHVVPLGIEYDRAVTPFKGSSRFKPNRVYILTIPKSSKAPFTIVEQHCEKAEKVKAFLKKQKVEVIVVETDLINILDVMKKISNIIREERKSGNIVYVNLSSAGRLTSIAAAFAGMFHNVKTYYVKPNGYSKSPEEREKHGITIVEGRDIIFLENFEILIPDELGLKVIVEIHKNRKMKSIDIIQFLVRTKEEGFENYYAVRTRKQKSKLLMKLNRRVMEKLENSGYVRKNKIGREKEYELTNSGEYIAHLCGLIPIDKKDIHKENKLP
ncbi:MAG: DUF6293 family protein [Candidatus Bathyarchaeota archaeon]|jgi:predicted transcriptional regulator